MLRVATGELQYTRKCDMICSTEVASKVIKRSLSRADRPRERSLLRRRRFRMDAI